jgi:hypothetical protein
MNYQIQQTLGTGAAEGQKPSFKHFQGRFPLNQLDKIDCGVF